MTDLTEKQEAAIQQMLNTLAQMNTLAGTRAQDFLTLTNGGAAIACLGLMGSSSPYASAPIVKILLAMFMLGLGFAGVTTIRAFRYATRIAWAFLDTLAQLRAGKAEWTDLMGALDPNGARHLFRWNVWFGGASLVLFGSGSLIACAWLICVAYR
jgi:hypothetical protein